MDKEQFVSIIKKINIAYDNPTCFQTVEGIELWYQCFKDCKVENFESAVIYLIKTKKKMFTIADLSEAYNNISTKQDEWQSV